VSFAFYRKFPVFSVKGINNTVDQEAFSHEISDGQEISGIGNLAEAGRVYSMSKNSSAISCLLNSFADAKLRKRLR